LPLKLFGLNAFKACLDEKLLLARYFHDDLGKIPGFEMGSKPDLSVVTYRFVPEEGDADEFNQRLLKAVHNDGKTFITSTRLNGNYTLRLAALHFRSHLDEVDYLLELLRYEARKLLDD
jgi:glutamate/tyrosine decarboxylase-like PLP-dependent enzyme